MKLQNHMNFISLENTNKVIDEQAHNSTLCLFIMNELDKIEKDLITEIANRNEEGQQWVPESRVRAQVQPNHSGQQITDGLQHLIMRRLMERISSPSGEACRLSSNYSVLYLVGSIFLAIKKLYKLRQLTHLVHFQRQHEQSNLHS